MPNLLTAPELAKILRIPLSEAWRLGREGALRTAVVRITNRMRFKRDLVERWMEAGGGDALNRDGASQ